MNEPVYITAEIEIGETISNLRDAERIEWITALLTTISEEGAIAKIRALVNEPKWDDQAP